MIPLGIKNFISYNVPLQYTVGVPWEYIRIRNESDNECVVTFSGTGSASLAAWVQDDFYVGSLFTGQITVTAVPTANNTILQGGYIQGNAYARGELKQPGSIMLVRVISLNQNQTLSNEGQPAGTIVIDVGTGANTQMTEIWNDHFIFRVQDASTNVQHQVMFGNTGGSPDYLQLGAAGDEVLVNGAFKVVQATHLDNGTINTDTTGAIIMTNNKALQWKNNALTTRTVLFMDNSNQTDLVAGDSGVVQIQDNAFVNMIKITGGSSVFSGNIVIPNSLTYMAEDTSAVNRKLLWLDAGVPNNTVISAGGGNIAFKSVADVLWGNMKAGVFQYGVSTATTSLQTTDNKSLIDFTTLDTYLKAINGKFNFQGDGTNTDWSRSAESRGTGTTNSGALVVTHNLKQHNVAVTPDIVIITPTGLPNGVWYVTAKGTTTFTLNTTTNWTFDWMAIKT